jgi:hypothetical protein
VTCESVRHGYVIECFWSGESAWGPRALEPIRQLRKALPAELFTVLCYNMDQDLPRAQEVLARCGADLPQIVGGPLLEVEILPESPLVRVLDREGVIRGIWVGWQPEYAAARELAIKLSGWGGR